MNDLDKKYGKDRIIDSPVSENATTGLAIGSAIHGKRPIVVHPRMDFMLLAMDPIVNQAANWSYMFKGEVSVSIVIRSIINRGGEQGAQHSQALQSFFMHVPGIKVVMPATPEDAKGLMVGAIYDNNPVMFIDDRWCYETIGSVSEELDPIPLGTAKIITEGEDLTIVASSYLVNEAVKSIELNSSSSIELINLRTIKPWDKELVIKSVEKTGRLLVLDTGWLNGGFSAEIAAYIGSSLHHKLDSPILRVGLPNSPAPCARTLEERYYPNHKTISAGIDVLLGDKNLQALDICTEQVPGLISY
jgi:pyruvate dehydrogenase E1 component beta subunit